MRAAAKKSAAFKPVTIEVTLETLEESRQLHALLNMVAIADELPDLSCIRAAIVEACRDVQGDGYYGIFSPLQKRIKDRFSAMVI
jgi:hypothetical protein